MELPAGTELVAIVNGDKMLLMTREGVAVYRGHTWDDPRYVAERIRLLQLPKETEENPPPQFERAPPTIPEWRAKPQWRAKPRLTPREARASVGFGGYDGIPVRSLALMDDADLVEQHAMVRALERQPVLPPSARA
jgi:hypothetical protein